MRTLLRYGPNTLFGAAYVAGLMIVWIGLQALVFGDGQLGRALATIAVGFAIWVALAAIARATPGGEP
jgi:hypothetical protein